MRWLRVSYPRLGVSVLSLLLLTTCFGSDRTIVLTYHDMVARRDTKALWFDCTTRELAHQLDWMTKRGAHFISLAQLFENMTSHGRLPSKSVAITFADNYEGFYLRAWPILKAKRIPVTLFVHTGFVGSRVGRPKMTWDQLRELKASGLVTVASQTVTHPADLALLSDAQVRKEMRDSKRTLDRELKQDTLFVAYPNGKFDARSLREAGNAGYRMGFTEDQRPAQLAANHFIVPRYVHTKYRLAWSTAGSQK